ncbi:MAG: ABC transporter permease, partial [Pseudohongiella sp.]|nr:ABC transporter permease [Pseudohongiella sp.]
MNTAKLSTGNHSLPRQQSAWLAARIALRYVSVGRRSQLVSFMSLLTIGGLALSVTILIAVLSVMNGFDREVRENVLGVLPHATVSTQERPRSASWMALDERLQAVPGIELTAPVLSANGVLSGPLGSKGVMVNGVDPQREQEISRLPRFMRAGSLQALAEQRFQIVLGQTLAEQMGVGIGDSVSLYSLNVSINPV